MPTLQEYQAQDDAYAKQVADQAAQKAQQEAFNGGQQPQQTFLQRWTAPVGRVTSQLLDSAVSAADRLYDTEPMRKARDVAAGAITGTTNIADAVMSHAAGGIAAAEHPGSDPERAPSPDEPTNQEVYKAAEPIWEHAKEHIMDFRDAVAVQDPTIADSLTQGVAQLAIPFAGYSRALSGLHGVAQMVAAGALTDATALQPHDARMADLIALGRHTEGKLGNVLRTLAPDGSAVNAYINYLSDRTNESEAEGRFKNVLDGFGANLIAIPLIHGAATVLKQGYSGLRYVLDNGVTSSSGLVPPSVQRGAVGDLTADAPAVTKTPAKPSSSLEADPTLTSARTFLQAQVDAGHEGSLHAMVTSLGQHIDAGTPDGKFYQQLLSKIASKQLDTKIVAPGVGSHPDLKSAPSGAAGRYSSATDSATLYPGAFVSNQRLIHTVTHEAVHAATIQAINSEPAVEAALNDLIEQARAPAAALGKTKVYGFTNPQEFVAEAESNPKFQGFLKTTKGADGKPLWDAYKQTIGGIFGLSGAMIAAPQFEALLSGQQPVEK